MYIGNFCKCLSIVIHSKYDRSGLQEEVEKREKVTQDLNNCLTNVANLTNSSSTCPPCHNSGLLGSTIGLIIVLIAVAITVVVILFYRNKHLIERFITLY